jgi:MEMO1 family protein
MQPNVRHPSVAEEFYPSDPRKLEELLSSLFSKASRQSVGNRVKAIIVPHAAYRYSGEISAKAFTSVMGSSYRTVILMGNAHAYLFDGIAIDGHDVWSSPLGDVPIDREKSRHLTGLAPDRFHELDIAHHCDHVLEVQLPFLQHALSPGFSILPLLFGENRPDVYRIAADNVIKVMTGDELLVASTDLSHYPSYRDARNIDNTTLEHMSRMDIEALERHEQEIRQRKIPGATSAFCSPDAVKTLLEICHRVGWKSGEPIYMNSGDAVHDDRQAVVGYGAIAFYES